MTVVTILDTLTEWARQNIASKIMLKVPPDSEDGADDGGYDYRLANPAVFAMYVPTKEKLPPGILSPYPSICVRFLEGSDELAAGLRSIGVQLCFSAWDPGTHGKDIILPNQNNPMGQRKLRGPEAYDKFQRNGDGWRDAWNLVDIALREIEQVTNINGLAIDRSTPVKFGPLAEQEAIPDFYPFWYAWASFSVTCPVIRAVQDYENLL